MENKPKLVQASLLAFFRKPHSNTSGQPISGNRVASDCTGSQAQPCVRAVAASRPHKPAARQQQQGSNRPKQCHGGKPTMRNQQQQQQQPGPTASCRLPAPTQGSLHPPPPVQPAADGSLHLAVKPAKERPASSLAAAVPPPPPPPPGPPAARVRRDSDSHLHDHVSEAPPVEAEQAAVDVGGDCSEVLEMNWERQAEVDVRMAEQAQAEAVPADREAPQPAAVDREAPQPAAATADSTDMQSLQVAPADAGSPERSAVKGESPGGSATQEGESAAESEEEEQKESPAPPPGPNPFELEREARIARNMEVLRQMGLLDIVAPSPKKKRPPPQRKKRQAPPSDAPPQPKRYSLRNRKAAAGGEEGAGAEGGAAGSRQQQQEAGVGGDPMDDPSVHHYICQPLNTSANHSGWEVGVPASSSVVGVAQREHSFMDPALSRIYSLHIADGLLVAAGKDGRASLYCLPSQGDASSSDPVEPQLSCRLHSGWIADVQLLGNCGFEGELAAAAVEEQGDGGSSSSSRRLLLSAGNDGCVALWDLSRVAQQTGLPKLLCKRSDIHSSGIFSMRERSLKVLTAGKDAVAAVTQLLPSGQMDGSTRYTELHDSVIKSARWLEEHTFVICGNDRTICIADIRSPANQSPCITIPDAHGGAINCVLPHPTTTHLLLSAASDPHVKLWDLRAPTASQPLFTLTGHTCSSRVSSIYSPVFLAGGRVVATGGEKSTALSLYCTTTGRTISRGDIGYCPQSLLAGSGGGLLLASSNRYIHTYTATCNSE